MVMASAALALSAFLFERDRTSINDNSALSCATARLISYVPAVQFEGEPRSNFLGWIVSRRDLLVEVRKRRRCSAETERLLAHRVRLDEAVLRETRP